MTVIEFVSIEWGRHDDFITVDHIRRRFFRPPVVTRVTYRGGCTVWRDKETGQSLPAWLESRLSDIWSHQRYLNRLKLEEAKI